MVKNNDLIKAGLTEEEIKRVHEIWKEIHLLSSEIPKFTAHNYRKQEKLGDELCAILYPKDYVTLKRRGYL